MEKFVLAVIGLMALVSFGETETVGDVTWRYKCDGEFAILVGDSGRDVTTISKHTVGAVTIPSYLNGFYVAEVSPEAFSGCQALTEINVEEDSVFFASVEGVLYDSDMRTLIRCPQKKTKVVIPEGVRKIAEGAFEGCTELESVTLPNSLDQIERNAFCGCTKLARIVIPSSVRVMDSGCLSGCFNLKEVYFEGDAPDVRMSYVMQSNATDEFGQYLYYLRREMLDDNTGSSSVTILDLGVPEGYYNVSYVLGCSQTRITDSASNYPVMERYWYCRYDSNLNYDIAQVPNPDYWTTNGHLLAVYDIVDSQGYPRTSPDLVTYARRGTSGWNWGDSSMEPTCWCGRKLVMQGDGGAPSGDNQDTPGTTGSLVTLVTTNIVVHYITQSVQSSAVAPITQGVGLVNVITEIAGGNVAIPESWIENFPAFTTKYGSDFTKALMKTTGKVDGAGNPMMVWQDYVAGTDPTKEDDVFRASVTMVEGMPVVSYTPELSDAEKALRKYTTWGKVKLQDETWIEVPEGHEADYNFFKVTVEMK